MNLRHPYEIIETGWFIDGIFLSRITGQLAIDPSVVEKARAAAAAALYSTSPSLTTTSLPTLNPLNLTTQSSQLAAAFSAQSRLAAAARDLYQSSFYSTGGAGKITLHKSYLNMISFLT